MSGDPTAAASDAAGLSAALSALASTPQLLVALDFDGTLSPVVDSPDKARALPEADAAIRRLAELPGTRVALVSGRSLASLEDVSQVPPSILLVGSHGVEMRLDGPAELALDAEQLDQVRALREVLESAAEPFREVWVEAKPAGFALHTRRASDDDRAAAERAALAAVEGSFDGLTLRRGKNVVEFSVRSETKGQGVALLKDFTGATGVLFAGDDVTDEDGFAVLGGADVGIKVGAGDTVAGFRVPEPEDVAAALAELADLRETSVGHRFGAERERDRPQPADRTSS